MAGGHVTGGIQHPVSTGNSWNRTQSQTVTKGRNWSRPFHLICNHLCTLSRTRNVYSVPIQDAGVKCSWHSQPTLAAA